ncbi:peptide chain release factor N(5)-glutamine methyltransferase [Thermodesulfatator autotrophicus]|uniref:Release factor glutamine methyltransferase n=1 Tax=Thermodesulfatator autotrophicus TaxID=1795632 RepID=A0A177E6U1_9BACT|nr:peptide chain release factor N(5)-glutamine methyltransferase [Thermodesulfatator autotrophicus]OAG27160.1 hypothetical protein TH606_08380 [Thermodesulfatator autotrophicus]
MPCVRDVLEKAQNLLISKGFSQSEAAFEARFILSFLLKMRPLDVFTISEISPEVSARFLNLVKKRAEGVPTAYLLGETEFFGRPFVVGPGVLIPRPETEILVEKVLETVSQGKILELGVGSGCISITLALEAPKLTLFGVELSSKALEYAKTNRRRYNLEKRVFWIRGNWLRPIKKNRQFKAIVSNPPYIAEKEWPFLEKEVKNYEPREALLAGPYGLHFIAKTLKEAPDYLVPGGYVFLEIGYQQKDGVAALAESLGYRYYFEKDLSGYYRVLVAKLK